MNARKTFLGLAGVALIAATGMLAASCGSSPNNNPAPSGSSGGSGATASGASAGTSMGASGASSGTTSTDGGVDATMTTADGGDGAAPAPEAAACNPTGAIYPADACSPCAANLLNACSTFNVTCISFDNSVVPDAHF
jgi:hypothetical protein